MAGMRHRLTIILVASCMLLELSGGSPMTQAPQAAVAGTVVDGRSKAPVEDAVVRGRRGNATIEVSTDAAGRFMLQSVDAGEITVTVEKVGYLQRRSNISADPNETVKGVVIPLHQTQSTISGRVLDSTGRPIPNVMATPLTYQSAADGRRELVSVVGDATDDRGDFRILVDPGTYLINISRNLLPSVQSAVAPSGMPPLLYPGVGEIMQAMPVTVKGGESVQLAPVIVAKARFGAVRLQILNPTAFPLANLRIDCCAPPPRISGETGVTTFIGGTTEDPISFPAGARMEKVFWPNQPGILGLIANYRRPDGTAQVLSIPIDFTGRDITVPAVLAVPEGRLAIQAVLDSDGAPLAGIQVNLGTPMAMGFASRPRILTNRTAADGRGTWLNISTGMYDLREIVGVSREFYLASASHRGRDALIERVAISADESVLELRFAGGAASIAGRVRQGNQSVHDATVAILPASDAAKSQLVNLRRVDRTDQEGRFNIQGVAPGEYRLYAWSPAHYPASSIYNNLYLDPQFIKTAKSAVATVTVVKGRDVTMDVSLPSD
jgi:hypothetical protein